MGRKLTFLLQEMNREANTMGSKASDVAVAQVDQVRQALGQGEQVLAVIGHLNSGQTLAAMELYKDMDLMVITPTSSEHRDSHREHSNACDNHHGRNQRIVPSAALCVPMRVFTCIGQLRLNLNPRI